jgi:hypothetical protein
MLDSGEPFDVRTVANARDLLSLCRNRCSLPQGVAKGYWNTLSVSWPKFELEVFEDRVEVHQFKDRGGTQIWEEYHSSGQEFSARFIEQLRRAKDGK